MGIRWTPWVVLVLGGVLACQKDDIGIPCVGMNLPNAGGSTSEGDVIRAEGPEIVEYNVNFPCDGVVCVATIGSGGYCSKECTEDRECPQAFVCRTVQDYGPLADRKYCVWRQCKTDADCGDPWTMTCKQAFASMSIWICALR
jgi:hypothetical protein